MTLGDLDISGNKLTVEATFTRTTSYSGGELSAGDLVSKNRDINDVNYLLRPDDAEITTTNGYFRTPDICDIDLNKTYHVAMVYDGTTLKFYRNGFLMSQVAATGNLLQNNWITTIGDLAYQPGTGGESFIGYIYQVQIWQIARTQDQIRQDMYQPLVDPPSQTGLRAYYVFDSTINKQGTGTWNGTLIGGATIQNSNPACNTFYADSCSAYNPVNEAVIASFNSPDSVCLNTPVTIQNTTRGGSTFYWNFTDSPLNMTPTGVNIGNPGNLLVSPTFIATVEDNGNYYGFLINYVPGNLIRLDFGNSLLNNPTAVKLGNFGGIIPAMDGAEGIQVIKNQGKWYAIIVGGQNSTNSSRIVKLDFGASITNTTPTATNWGNLGDLAQPLDLYLFQEEGKWYGFTVNGENNTITRFDFSSSFDNTPIGYNLGNLGNIHYPTGIFVINDDGYWRVFVTNGWDNSSITRLDFGSSLLSVPTAVNLGNLGNLLARPRDMYIIKTCTGAVGYVVNGRTDANNIVRLDFRNGLDNIPEASLLGNIGQLSFPHSLSKIFRVGADLYSFVTNVNSSTITRLKFQGYSSTLVPNSSDSLHNPVLYTTPGTYHINLMIDDELPTQSSYCKNVVVLPLPDVKTLNDTSLCNGSSIVLNTTSQNGSTFSWSPSSGLSNANTKNPVASPVNTTRYIVTAKTSENCSAKDTVTVTVLQVPTLTVSNDTLVCAGTSVNISASSSITATYHWSPATGLNNPDIANPVAVQNGTTNYHVTATATNGCTATDSVMLNIHQLPAFSIVPNQVSICSGTTTTLSASGADTYTWSPANDITNPHDFSINVAPTVNTTYKVILKDVICNVTDTLTSAVTLKPSPSTTVSKTNNVDCVIGQSALTATGGTQYAWSPSGTLSNPNIANPVATPTETTVYHVIVTNAEGCSVEDSIEVQVIIGSVENGYLLPTAFTPNNDGNNDCFGIKKWGPVTNLDFTIYNRLGNPIFHTTNPGDCWDGTFKGKKQAAGTYIYQISAKTLCGSISRRGTVILIP